MFKNVVLLKVSPWFLYADSEKDALNICTHYGSDAVGVVMGQDLIVKQPKMKMTLEQDQVLQITNESKEEPDHNRDDEESHINMEQASKELEDEFNKLQSEAS